MYLTLDTNNFNLNEEKAASENNFKWNTNGLSTRYESSSASSSNMDIKPSPLTSDNCYTNIRLIGSLVIIIGLLVTEFIVFFNFYKEHLSAMLPNVILILYLTSFFWICLFKSISSIMIIIHLDCVNRNINYIHEQLRQYISSKSNNSPLVPKVTMMNSVTGSSTSLKVSSEPTSLTDIRQQFKRITNHFETMNDILSTPLGALTYHGCILP